MFDDTHDTEATRTLASTIPQAALARVRRHRAAVAVHANASRLRHGVLEQDDDASRVRGATTATVRYRAKLNAFKRQDDIKVQRIWLSWQWAERHGLDPAARRFGPAALASNARIGTHGNGGTDAADAWPYPEGDHVYLYERNGRAACAVAHVYAVSTSPEKVRDRCETFAGRAGLRVTFPRYPSWWFPGETLLVAYWPDDPDDEGCMF